MSFLNLITVQCESMNCLSRIVLANLGQERLQQAEQRIQILLKKNATTELSDYQIEE